MRRHTPFEPIDPNSCVWGGVHDVINCANFCENRSRGLGAGIPRKMAFLIESVLRPYNSVSTTVLHCDVPFQWEGRNFDSHSSQIFHPISLKLKTKKHIRDTNQRAKVGKDRFTRGVLAVHSGLPFLYFLYSSLSIPVAPHVIQRPMRAQTACFRPRKCLLGV